MSMCPMCIAGLPTSCLGGSCGQTEPAVPEGLSPAETPSHTAVATETTSDVRDNIRSYRAGRKGGSKTQTAGRKAAARLYPLDRDAPCEWQNCSDNGGGNFPILGCVDGKQQARHHGPEKNVHNNEEGNVHRICHYCHYRWHRANDASYDWNAGIWPLHNPRPMTESEKRIAILDGMRYQAGKKPKFKELD